MHVGRHTLFSLCFLALILSTTLEFLLAPAPLVVAQSASTLFGPPDPPVLPLPPQNDGPFVEESLGSCEIEVELLESDIPIAIEDVTRGSCSGPQGGQRWARNFLLDTRNGYVVEGEADVRNYCPEVRDGQRQHGDAITVALNTIPQVPGDPPPDGLAIVRSDPEATVLSYTEKLGRAEGFIEFEVQSSSTTVDSIFQALALSAYDLGPTVGASGGFTLTILGVGGGAQFGQTLNPVMGLGVQRASFTSLALIDQKDTPSEYTTVGCYQRVKVWARGGSAVGGDQSSYAQTYVEEWFPNTTSELRCGPDLDFDGFPDHFVKVSW